MMTKFNDISKDSIDLIFMFILGYYSPEYTCECRKSGVVCDIEWLEELRLISKMFNNSVGCILKNFILPMTPYCPRNYTNCYGSNLNQGFSFVRKVLNDCQSKFIKVNIPLSAKTAIGYPLNMLSSVFHENVGRNLESLCVHTRFPFTKLKNTVANQVEVLTTEFPALRSLTLIIERYEFLTRISAADCEVFVVFIKTCIRYFGRNLSSLKISCVLNTPYQLFEGCPDSLSVHAMNGLISSDCPFLSSLQLYGQLSVSLLKDIACCITSNTTKCISLANVHSRPGSTHDVLQLASTALSTFANLDLDLFVVNHDFEYDDDFSTDILPTLSRDIRNLKIVGNDITPHIMIDIIGSIIISTSEFSALEYLEIKYDRWFCSNVGTSWNKELSTLIICLFHKYRTLNTLVIPDGSLNTMWYRSIIPGIIPPSFLFTGNGHTMVISRIN